MQKKLQNIILVVPIIVSLIALSCGAEVLDSKLHIGELTNAGTYKVRVDKYLEPAALPFRLTLSVLCGEAVFSKNVLEDEMSCEFVSATVQKNVFILTYKVQNKTGESCSEIKTFKKEVSILCK